MDHGPQHVRNYPSGRIIVTAEDLENIWKFREASDLQYLEIYVMLKSQYEMNWFIRQGSKIGTKKLYLRRKKALTKE